VKNTAILALSIICIIGTYELVSWLIRAVERRINRSKERKATDGAAPLCVDCRHYRPCNFHGKAGPWQWCAREAYTVTDPVNGHKTQGGVRQCLWERSVQDSGNCGPRGRHFEPKDDPGSAVDRLIQETAPPGEGPAA
jgi:hypothetical protein